MWALCLLTVSTGGDHRVDFKPCGLCAVFALWVSAVFDAPKRQAATAGRSDRDDVGHPVSVVSVDMHGS